MFVYTLCIILLAQVTNTSAIFEGKQCDSEHHTFHSEWKIAIFHEYVVENLKYMVPGTFFRVKYYPFFAAILRGLLGCSFKGLSNPKIDVPKNIYSLELNEYSCPNIVWSLVLIDSILILKRGLVFAVNFWLWVMRSLSSGSLKTAFSDFRKFMKI